MNRIEFDEFCQSVHAFWFVGEVTEVQVWAAEDHDVDSATIATYDEHWQIIVFKLQLAATLNQRQSRKEGKDEANKQTFRGAVAFYAIHPSQVSHATNAYRDSNVCNASRE